MIEVEIKQEAVEHLAAQGSLDLETAEQVLQECLSLCEIHNAPQTNGAGDLVRVAEELLKWRAKLHLICAPYRDEMEGAIFALTDLSTVVHHIRQGSASKPADVEN